MLLEVKGRLPLGEGDDFWEGWICLFGGKGSCCNEVGWSALMSWGKAVWRHDCGRSMPDGSRIVIGLEFWTNGGGSMIGFGGF